MSNLHLVVDNTKKIKLPLDVGNLDIPRKAYTVQVLKSETVQLNNEEITITTYKISEGPYKNITITSTKDLLVK